MTYLREYSIPEPIAEWKINIEFEKLVNKLTQFRRHPDYRRAFDRILSTKREQFLTVELPDGRRGIPETAVETLIDAVDQEFIEEIIRLGN
jgi:hypothetical protein